MTSGDPWAPRSRLLANRKLKRSLADVRRHMREKGGYLKRLVEERKQKEPRRRFLAGSDGPDGRGRGLR